MLCRYEGKQCSHPTLGKKEKKKIMSLTKHLRYVIPQKQKSSLSAPAHEAGQSSDERQAENTASMKSSAQEA